MVVVVSLMMQHAWRAQNRGVGALPVGRHSTYGVLFDLFKYFQTHSNLKRSKIVFYCSKIFT
jgi:hypothetical protein